MHLWVESHYGASRLCEAASRQDVRGSLRSLRSEVLLQTFMQRSLIIISKLATTHGTAKEAAKSGDAVKTIEAAEGIEATEGIRGC